MDIVEYAIRFRDMASGPLGRLNAGMRESIALSGRMGRAGREAGGSFARAFDLGGLLKGGAIVGAVASAGRAAGRLFAQSMQQSLDRQQVQASFNVLAGGEEAGRRLSAQLVALQRDTILGGEVFQNAQTMLGFGFGADEVARDLEMLGNASMGNAEKLGALTLAYSQVRAAGKLTGQDLLQFVNAGFNPLQQMAERTGKDMGTLRDEMSEGLITFADVRQAFVDATSEGGRFDNMLARLADTPAGKAQQLKGMWGEVKVAIGNAFMPLMEAGLEIGQRLMPAIERLTVPLAEGVRRVLGYVRQLSGTTDSWRGLLGGVLSILQPVWEVLQAVGGLVFGMVRDLVEFIKGSTLLRDIFLTIGFVVQKVLGAVKWLIGQIKALWDNLIKPILNAIERGWRWLNGYDADTPRTTEPAPAPAPEEKKRAAEANDLLRGIADNTRRNTEASRAAGSTISGGGQKVININVQKFFDSINFTTNNLRETATDLERTVLEVLSRVLVQGAASAV